MNSKIFSIFKQNFFKNKTFKKLLSNNFNFSTQMSSNPNHAEINIDDILLKEKDKNQQNVREVSQSEISLDIFMKLSLNYLNKIHKAFINVQQYEDIKIEFDKNNFFLRVTMSKIGTWIFVREMDTKNLTFTSPISGFFKYKYDPISEFWVSIKDGHILDDLVIREFCKVSKGLLYFD